MFAVAVLAAGAITANRYDVAVALSLAACLFFLARRHTTAAGAALGVGVALKLTPGMLLPLVLIVAETRRRASTPSPASSSSPSCRSCRSSAAGTG